MAYKDEYEVARLYTDGDFLQAGRRPVRGSLPAALPSGAAALGGARPGDRASAKARTMGRGCSARSACWRGCASCAARRSTFSGAPPSASAERRLARRIRGAARSRSLLRSRRRTTRPPSNSPPAAGDPRLWSRQGGQSQARQGKGGGSAGPLPLALGPTGARRGVKNAFPSKARTNLSANEKWVPGPCARRNPLLGRSRACPLGPRLRGERISECDFTPPPGGAGRCRVRRPAPGCRGRSSSTARNR